MPDEREQIEFHLEWLNVLLLLYVVVSVAVAELDSLSSEEILVIDIVAGDNQSAMASCCNASTSIRVSARPSHDLKATWHWLIYHQPPPY